MTRSLLCILIALFALSTFTFCSATRTSGFSITNVQTGHWETVEGRYWVPPQTQRYYVPATYFNGRIIQPSHWETYTTPGHWEYYCYRVWVSDRW